MTARPGSLEQGKGMGRTPQEPGRPSLFHRIETGAGDHRGEPVKPGPAKKPSFRGLAGDTKVKIGRAMVRVCGGNEAHSDDSRES